MTPLGFVEESQIKITDLLVTGCVCGSRADFSCVILAGKSKEVILLSTNIDLSRLNSYVQCHCKQN